MINIIRPLKVLKIIPILPEGTVWEISTYGSEGVGQSLNGQFFQWKSSLTTFAALSFLNGMSFSLQR